MKKLFPTLAVLLLLALSACSNSDDGGALEESPAVEASKSPEASVAFTSPSDGSKVTSPVKLQMKAVGLTVEPAGEVHENAGHLHVMVDTGCVEAGQVIPKDDAHLHYGMAQTEAELTLTPGEHELCLQVGDGAHVALPITKTINITVE